ncbi:MAG: ATP-binding protein [Candidatus Aramenus sp.]|nr:ATP-binding protein [Candidatus Aramenus sp.]
MEQIVGYVIGTSTTQQATMLAKQAVRLGRYVTLEYDGQKVLGLITSVTRGSPLINDSLDDVEILDDIIYVQKVPRFIRAEIKLLYDLTSKSLPQVPPPPGTQVRFSQENELQSLFSEGEIEIGKLIGTNVAVKIKVNSLARHLAILAATGSGKSNTVAVLTQRISEIGGSVLIFDYHGEYYNSDIKNLNPIEPKLNPRYLSPREFATLLEIPRNATIQYRILRKAFTEYLKDLENSFNSGQVDLSKLNETFVADLESRIEKSLEESSRKNKDSAEEVENKLEEFFERYSNVIDLTAPDITSRIRSRSVNVVDISHLDEDSMDAIVSHYLRRVLDSRKSYKRTGNGLRFPVILVIEEAHVFISKTENTLTKAWAGKIAREGRKFGVSMVIVSQRPKGLDDTILSQMTNKIILKIVEPNDKKYVLESSDNLSEDLVSQLSSLDVGEAIVIGNLVRIPSFVKIDKFEGKLGGSDPDMIGEWRKEEEENNVRSSVADFG